MPGRKHVLVDGEVYHIVTRSIAKFVVFNNDSEFSRILAVMRYYQYKRPDIKFSRFAILNETKNTYCVPRQDLLVRKEKSVQIITYCLMPTHIHLILKQLMHNGISDFMGNVLNSYSRYFNLKHRRKGPLWEGRFKSILVEDNEYLLHLTRYIHLNPVTARLVDRPEDWNMSSYNEYVAAVDSEDCICQYDGILDINSDSYEQLVRNRISYQRELAQIKSLLLEEPLFSTPEVEKV